MNALFYLVAAFAGLMNPLQAAATAALEKLIHRPFTVGVVSASGTFLLTLAGSVLFGQLGFAGKAGEVPWWVWCSGLFGSVFLIAQPVAGARIGAGAYIGLTVTVATIASIVIDHYGWLEFPQHAASPLRIAGGALMVAGVSLVALF